MLPIQCGILSFCQPSPKSLSENFGEEQLTKIYKFGIRTNYSFVSYTLLSWEILKPRDVSFINGTGKLSIIVQNIEAT